MEEWKIYFTWREDANGGALKYDTMQVTACCVNDALRQFERHSGIHINARVRGAWAVSKEEREGK